MPVRLEDLGNGTAEVMRGQILSYASALALVEHRQQHQAGAVARAIEISRQRLKMTPEESAKMAALAPASAEIVPANPVQLAGLAKPAMIRIHYGEGEAAAKLLYPAVKLAWDAILRLMRRKSGYAEDSMVIFCQDKDKKLPSMEFKDAGGALRSWLEQAQTSNVAVSIIGPTVPYRRKLIYNPKDRVYRVIDGATGKRKDIIKSQQQVIWSRLSDAYTRKGRKEIDRYKFVRQGLETKVFSSRKTGETLLAKRSRKFAESLVLRGRKRGRQTTYSAQVVRAIHAMVMARVKNQFREVWVNYSFTQGPKIKMFPSRTGERRVYGENVPRLYFMIKQRSTDVRGRVV